ncbi:hypothetical protein V9T40_008276 [Parthenolecanium corni]|uniref:Uncharacterized protein n=1 Tax=Parthenolecanium corni TaxID=536013 RepID=A0AAN9TQA2_9HEMI
MCTFSRHVTSRRFASVRLPPPPPPPRRASLALEQHRGDGRKMERANLELGSEETRSAAQRSAALATSLAADAALTLELELKKAIAPRKRKPKSKEAQRKARSLISARRCVCEGATRRRGVSCVVERGTKLEVC